MLCTKFQPNISSGSGEKVDFSGLAVFSNSSHFFVLNQAEFYHSETLLHVKFENHGCSSFRE